MIILIIGILAILQCLNYIIFKPKYNTLNCGIFGQLTKRPENLSISDFNLLGIYNIERGKNSCGITYDGETHHGINEDKLYIDFIKNRPIKPKLYPSIIGHTRQASPGNIISLNNSHPFGFGDLNDGYAFVGVHNGTLKNHEELATKYGIELQVPSGNLLRTKIDSEILLEILYKEQNFKVLSEYIGAAALVWSWLAEPNKVYLWSGASKEYDYTTSKVEEERPLCVYLRSKNNMFISSLLDSLSAIGGNKENSFQIEYNTVYCVTDGDFKNAETWKISRENATQNIPYKNTWSNKNYNLNGQHADYSNYGRYPDSVEEYYEDLCKNKRHDYKKQFPSDNRTSVLNIHEEKLPNDQNSYGKRIYFNKLRYYQNGHTINGIYCYIKDYGFMYLSTKFQDAEAILEAMKGMTFKDGAFQVTTNLMDNIPFKLGSKNMSLFYFVEGVQMRTFLDYVAMTDAKSKLKAGTYLPYRDLSHVSKHPVINISTSGTTSREKQEILYNGILCNTIDGGICPLGSERIYYITDGNLKKLVLRQDLVRESVIQLPINFEKKEEKKDFNFLNEVTNNLTLLESKIVEKEKSDIQFEMTLQNDDKFIEQIKNNAFPNNLQPHEKEAFDKIVAEEEENELIEGIINEDLTDPVQEIINLKGKLEAYLPNKKAKESVELLDQMLDVINLFMIKDNLNKK